MEFFQACTINNRSKIFPQNDIQYSTLLGHAHEHVNGLPTMIQASLWIHTIVLSHQLAVKWGPHTCAVVNASHLWLPSTSNMPLDTTINSSVRICTQPRTSTDEIFY